MGVRRLILLALLGGSLLGGLFWYIGPLEIFTAMRRASPLWLFVSSLFMLLARLIKALRWRALLEPIKSRVALSSAFWASSIGLMINVLVPLRLGELAQAYVVSMKERMGLGVGFSSVLMERLMDMLGLALIGLGALMTIQIELRASSMVAAVLSTTIALIGIAIAGILIGTKKKEWALKQLRHLFSRMRLPSSLTERAMRTSASMIDSLTVLQRSPGYLLMSLVLTAALWIAQYLSLLFLFRAFGHSAPLSLLLLGAVAFYLTMMLPSAPGQAGTYEAYWTGIFLGMGLGGAEEILAMGLTNHLIGLTLTMTLGGLGIYTVGVSLNSLLSYKTRSTGHS